MGTGVLAGYPMDSMSVELMDGSFHAVDSDQLSFELAAKMAYRHAIKSCTPKILEPMMSLEVRTPEANMGDVIGDLNKRRGMVEEYRLEKCLIDSVRRFGGGPPCIWTIGGRKTIPSAGDGNAGNLHAGDGGAEGAIVGVIFG